MDTKTEKQYPQLEEIFELTLYGDAQENTPLGMINTFGYNPKDWNHNGPVITDRQTKKFKLVSIGHQLSWDEVVKALKQYGHIPEGQWIKAFNDVYISPDDNGNIGIADASWFDQFSYANFPFIYIEDEMNGKLAFNWTSVVFNKDWRWIVPVSE